MENKLTVQQLGRRLGSGLKMMDGNGYIYGVDNNEISIHEILNHKENKPILRTDLTKPITHNGETFVPIERLLKLKFPKFKVSEFYRVNKYTKYITVSATDGNGDIDFHFYKQVGINEYWIIELLISWHFVIDEPEGSYIKAEEMEVNPCDV